MTITGDESLQKRPMRRIVAPLAKMGVDFKPETPETLPITVCGNRALRAIDYASPMASAQLKTCLLYTSDVYKRQVVDKIDFDSLVFETDDE